MRSGQKVDGKTRYFRTGDCAVPEREAGSVFGPANTIEEVRRRIAQSLQIYVIFETSVFGFANTIEESRRRIAPRLQIYVRSETTVFGFANSIEKVTHKVSKVT